MEDQKQHWADLAKFGQVASVIDPNDTLGFKNRYIVDLRNSVFKKNLLLNKGVVVDLGCGTGNLSKLLANDTIKVIGIDISFDLLKFAVFQNNPKWTMFIQYDGNHLPLKNNSVNYVTTYVVLNHVKENNHLVELLKEIHRILADDGKLICIEQIRKFSKYIPEDFKHQRSETDFRNLFLQSGFKVEEMKFLRHGKFPLIYIIRLGLIPVKFFSIIAKIDKFFASIFNKPTFSYIDTLFVLIKSQKSNG